MIYIMYAVHAVKFPCKTFVVAVATVWLDTRTAVTVNEMIAKTPGLNQDHLRVPHLVSCHCNYYVKFVSEFCRRVRTLY